MNIERYSCDWINQSFDYEIKEELLNNNEIFVKVFKNDLKISCDFKSVEKLVKILKKDIGFVDKRIAKLMAKIINANPDKNYQYNLIDLLDIVEPNLIDKLVDKAHIDLILFKNACANSRPEVIKALIPKFSSLNDLTEGFLAFLTNPHANPDLIREFVSRQVDINSYVNRLWTEISYSPQIIDVLLDLHADMGLTDLSSNSLLHAACRNPRVDSNLIQKMIDAKADVNQVNFDEETPLTLACRFNTEIIETLLRNNANVCTITDSYETPLSLIVQNEKASFKIIERFIEEGAECSYRENDGSTMLHRLVANPALSADEILKILNLAPQLKSFLDDKNSFGYTPLHLAALTNLKNIPMLLSLGADPDILDNNQNSYIDSVFKNPKLTTSDIHELAIDLNAKDAFLQTYLHRACIYYPSAINILIENGAEINALNSKQNSPLHLACKNPNIKVEDITLLVKNGADPNLRNDEGATPFLIACFSKTKIWKVLLDYGGDPLITDVDGNTSIHGLCLNSSTREGDLKILIEKGVKVNAKNSLGRTPLYNAAISNTCLINELISLEADVVSLDDNKNTLLHLLCTNENLRPFDLIVFLRNLDFDINATNIFGQTPLHLATRHNPQIVEFLIKNGADVNKQDNIGLTPFLTLTDPSLIKFFIPICDIAHLDAKGRNALHIACLENLQMIEALLDLSNYTQQVDLSGNTPLHYACNNPEIEFQSITQLIRKDNFLSVLNNEFQTPLYLLCLNNPDFIPQLIQEGLDINLADHEGKTQLHRACLGKHPEVAQTLLLNGANVSIFDLQGNTPLHYAYANPDFDPSFISLLEQAGANISFENKAKETPLEMALKHTGEGRIRKLMDFGLDINRKDSQGNTALHKACLRHAELIRPLLNLGADPKALDENNETPLFHACRNPKMVFSNLEPLLSVSDIYHRGNRRYTPLLLMCSYHPDLTDHFLRESADFQTKEDRGNTCLHFLAYCPQVTDEDVSKFVKGGLSVDSQNFQKSTPLHHACNFNQNAIAPLLKHSANVNAVNKLRETPLHLFCSNPNSTVESLLMLISANANVNAATNDLLTPLHFACIRAPHLIETLLSHGAKMTADIGGYTPIHYTARKNISPEYISMLLNSKADINAQLQNGKTFLHLVCILNPQLIEFALLNGASPNTLDKEGITPLMDACSNVEVEPQDLSFLFERYTEVNATSAAGNTALHYSCRYNPKLVQILIQKGANVHESDQDGLTPFHLICQNFMSTTDDLQTLVSAGAKTHELTKEKETALELACKSSNAEIINALLQQNSDLGDQTDLKGRSLLNLLCSNPHITSHELVDFIFMGIQLKGFDHPDFRKSVLAKALVEQGLAPVVMTSIKNGIGIDTIFEALNTTGWFYTNDDFFLFFREELLNCFNNPIQLGLDRHETGRAIKKALTKRISDWLRHEDNFRLNPFYIPFLLQDPNLMQLFKQTAHSGFLESFLNSIRNQSFASEDLTNVSYIVDRSHLAKGLKVDENIPEAPFFDLTKFNEMLAEVNFYDPQGPGYRNPNNLTKDGDSTNVSELTHGMASLIERVMKKTKEFEGVPKDHDDYERYYANFQNLLMWFGPHLHTLDPGERADVLVDIAIAGLFCGTRYFELKNLYDIHFPNNQGEEETHIPIFEKHLCEHLTARRLGILENWALKLPGQSIHKMNQLMFLVGKELHLPNAEMYYADQYAGINLSTSEVLEKFYREYTPAAIIKYAEQYILECLNMPRLRGQVFDWFQANPPESFRQEENCAILARIQELKKEGVPRSKIREILKAEMQITLYPDSSIEDILHEHQARSYKNEYLRPSISEYKKEYYSFIFEKIEQMQNESFVTVKIFLETNGIASVLFDKIENREYLERIKVGSSNEFAKFIVEEHRRQAYEDGLILEKDWKKEEYDEIRKNLTGKSREEARRYLKKHRLGFQLTKDRSFKYLLESDRGIRYLESVISFDEENWENPNYSINLKAIIHMLNKMQILNNVL